MTTSFAHRIGALIVWVCVCAMVGRLGGQSAPNAGQTPEQRAHALVDLLVKQDFAAVVAGFDATMKAAVSEAQLRLGWTSTLQQVGAFRRQASTRVDARGALQIVVVTCEFERSAIDVQVVYDAAGLIAGLSLRPATVPWTSPPYATAGAYTEQDTTVGAGEWELPGTLTLPVGAGPFPAVVLVHGSGANDRDESIGATKLFKDLALGLASRGVAVLRFDKRSRVYGAKLAILPRFTVKDEVIDDALLAVARLRTTPRVDPAGIVVLGHSLGGMLVPRIGLADPRIAGFIVMAGLVRALDETMLTQSRYLAMADGTISPAEQRQIDDMQKLVDTVKQMTPADAANPALISGAPAAYWLDLRGYDPPAVAAGLTAPMLILQGERDYQVTMDGDFVKWKAALGSKTTVTFHSYPALNHAFTAGTGPSLPGEYNVPGHADPDVIRDIAEWIARLK